MRGLALAVSVVVLAAVAAGSGSPATSGPCTVSRDYEGTIRAVAWRPDGRRIAFTRAYDRSSGHVRVYDVDPKGGAVRALSPCIEAAGYARLTWSPHSDALILEQHDAFDKLGSRWLVNADASGVTPLPDGVHTDWSPDGSQIVYERGEKIYVAPVSGRPERALVSGTSPAWSPDGTEIAFTRDGVRAIHPDGTAERRIANGANPAWSPDGSRIALVELSVSQQDTSSFDARVVVVRSDGTGRRALGTENTDLQTVKPSWVAPGKLVAMPGLPATLYPVDGGKPRLVRTPFDTSLGVVSFSPDGTRLVGAVEDLCAPTLFVVALKGRGLHRFDRNCFINGTSRNDVLVGTDRHDEISGGAGNDRINGRGGDDDLDGGAGRDRILAGAGDDQVWGDAGADVVLGGPGNDQLIDEDGGDRLYGGPGNDLFMVMGPGTRVSCGTGRDVAKVTRGTRVASDCETVIRHAA